MDPDQIEQLRDPDVFPSGERGQSIEIVQTHLSIVCLVGDRAYKWKKPIRLPFVDFSTSEKRRFYCEEELRLNRRLCPEVYLRVLPVTRGPEGRWRVGGTKGEVIDWVLEMRRLPAEQMMDSRLASHQVSPGEVEEIARKVVEFHRRAERSPEISRWGCPDRLRDFAFANFEETRGSIGLVFPPDLHGVMEARTRADFSRWLPLMRERAAAGCIVDGHGDLHARNICLQKPPAIYDCIEFNPEFRCGDVATEHAFLAMDLRFREHPELAECYQNAVIALSGDEKIRDLLPMLIRYRAMVRAKVAAIAAGEEELPAPQRIEATRSARRHLTLAAATAVEESGPWWVMFCGLPASGKSSIAAALRAGSGNAWPVFSTDLIRKELAGVEPEHHLPEKFYSSEFSRRTYGELRSRAGVATERGEPVVLLDANFRKREDRQSVLRAAREVGASLALLSLEAREQTILGRLEERSRDGRTVSDADPETYQKLKAEFEKPEKGEADREVLVPEGLSAEEAADHVLARMLDEEGGKK